MFTTLHYFPCITFSSTLYHASFMNWNIWNNELMNAYHTHPILKWPKTIPNSCVAFYSITFNKIWGSPGPNIYVEIFHPILLALILIHLTKETGVTVLNDIFLAPPPLLPSRSQYGKFDCIAEDLRWLTDFHSESICQFPELVKTRAGGRRLNNTHLGTTDRVSVMGQSWHFVIVLQVYKSKVLIFKP